MNPPRIRLMIVDDHAMVRDGLKAVFGLVEDMEVVAEAASPAVAKAAVGAREGGNRPVGLLAWRGSRHPVPAPHIPHLPPSRKFINSPHVLGSV
jgi:hypothetical protein